LVATDVKRGVCVAEDGARRCRPALNRALERV
jgi:hypothetical protein